MTRFLAILALYSIALETPFRANPLKPGGATTTFNHSREAFAQPLENLDAKALASFFSGDTVFNSNWVSAASVVQSRDGLGPLFNTRSCSSCHFKDGRGRPPEYDETPEGFLIRISAPGSTSDTSPLPDPVYGNQLSFRALEGLPPEAKLSITYEDIEGEYDDGEPFRIQKPIYSVTELGYGDLSDGILLSPRVAPSVFGLGLLDAIPNSIIIAQSDPLDENKDGISGRLNWVWSESQQSPQLGKFGWKANRSHLIDQAAGAFQGDIGITSNLFPTENHTSVQMSDDKRFSGGKPELSDSDLSDVVFYLKTLAVPVARFEDLSSYQEGYRLFAQSGCASCHTPKYQTDSSSPIPALANQTIYPYTDLLLHDMGEGLADGRPDFEASGNEWRTPPLWGLGLIQKVNGHTRLLHDGRARNIEEAILWHGGEAEQSKRSFKRLSKPDRIALIDFIQRL